ncbi:hypothetical protein F4802DRAFT_594046 [Xylaria palmicola]|nr:hypothetical protein F4802DRAFT_594046 [Xylaria palmicola]
MAPQLPLPSSLTFDSRTQIIDNCEYLISKDDIIQVIASKNPKDKLFKAYAVRCNEDTRELVLASEPCETAQRAVESLHTKSCEAVHNYVATNGFSSPRIFKTAFLGANLDDDDDDDAASVISGHSDSSTAALSEWGSSGDEAMMLQYAPDPNGAPNNRPRPTGRQNNRDVTTASTRERGGGSRSRAAVRDADYTNPAPPRARPARPARSRSPTFVFRQAPPPPPPGPLGHLNSDGPAGPPPSTRGILMPPPHARPFLSTMPVGPHAARLQNGMNPPVLPVQPFRGFCHPGLTADGPPFLASQGPNRPPKPPGLNPGDNNSGNGHGHGHGHGLASNPPGRAPVFYHNPRTYTVRITVNWLRHGRHRIIAQCHPTRESLEGVAVSDVRVNPGAFVSESRGSKGACSSSASTTATAGRGGCDGWDGERPCLRAHVRRAEVAGEPYDMRAFRAEDLTRLFNVMSADDGIPSFEVVVKEVSCGTDDDDDDDDDDDGEGEAATGTGIRGPKGAMKVESWD